MKGVNALGLASGGSASEDFEERPNQSASPAFPVKVMKLRLETVFIVQVTEK